LSVDKVVLYVDGVFVESFLGGSDSPLILYGWHRINAGKVSYSRFKFAVNDEVRKSIEREKERVTESECEMGSGIARLERTARLGSIRAEVFEYNKTHITPMTEADNVHIDPAGVAMRTKGESTPPVSLKKLPLLTDAGARVTADRHWVHGTTGERVAVLQVRYNALGDMPEHTTHRPPPLPFKQSAADEGGEKSKEKESDELSDGDHGVNDKEWDMLEGVSPSTA